MHSYAPIVQALNWTRTYVAGMPMIKFRNNMDVQSEFVAAYVSEILPNHTDHTQTIYDLAITSNSIMYSSCKIDNLRESGILYAETEQKYISPRQIITNKIPISLFRKMISTQDNADLLVWLDALYAAVQLLNSQINVRVACIDRHDVLRAFAEADYPNEFGYSPISSHTNSPVRTDDLSVGVYDLDYFVI